MIIVVNGDDDSLMDIANAAANGDAGTFGAVFRIRDASEGGDIPALGSNEHLFILGHGALEDGSGLATIGNADGSPGSFGMNGSELYDHVVERIVPEGYQGAVHVDACESADFLTNITSEAQDGFEFSFCDTLQNRIQGSPASHETIVYGRLGAVGDGLPAPNDQAWTRTGVDMEAMMAARLAELQQEEQQHEQQDEEMKEREEQEEEREREEHEHQGH